MRRSVPALLLTLLSLRLEGLFASQFAATSLIRLRGGEDGRKPSIGQFDPSLAEKGLARMWAREAEFGKECKPNDLYLEEIVSDRFALSRGAQLIRDELMLSFNKPKHSFQGSKTANSDVQECAADLSVPSIMSTCGYTNCGDRICQTRALQLYLSTVAGRFASITETAEPKPELFFATGGGTDNGATLAHVTVAHSIDPEIKQQIYSGNSKSFLMCSIDISTHCGHLDVGEGHEATFQGNTYRDVNAIYGLAQESVYRDPRPTCGAIVGMLYNFNLDNNVHVRLRRDLGEDNYNFLTKNEVLADDGSPITCLIAAAIIAIQGMHNTLNALGSGGELDERGLGHVTAQVLLNNGDNREAILHCARGTSFNGEIKVQGLGTDATKYSGRMVTSAFDHTHKCIELTYDGQPGVFPVSTASFKIPNEASQAARESAEVKDTVRPEVKGAATDGAKGTWLQSLGQYFSSSSRRDSHADESSEVRGNPVLETDSVHEDDAHKLSDAVREAGEGLALVAAAPEAPQAQDAHDSKSSGCTCCRSGSEEAIEAVPAKKKEAGWKQAVEGLKTKAKEVAQSEGGQRLLGGLGTLAALAVANASGGAGPSQQHPRRVKPPTRSRSLVEIGADNIKAGIAAMVVDR